MKTPPRFEILRKTELKVSEFEKANQIALDLDDFLKLPSTIKAIGEVHKVGGKSNEIENILRPKLDKIGFTSQAKGLFAEYETPSLRPDFLFELSTDSGILIEVERGRILSNNMDILDVWKCHICKKANYLFLVIPQVRQTRKKKETPIYDQVIKRLRSFFQSEQNYINVDAIFVLGY